jgi:hypothetical protein
VFDYYLVAQAHAAGHTVVTHEIPSASTRRIKIPDACIGLSIKCMTPFEMLRASERGLSWVHNHDTVERSCLGSLPFNKGCEGGPQ